MRVVHSTFTSLKSRNFIIFLNMTCFGFTSAYFKSLSKIAKSKIVYFHGGRL
jgi:hypothetical protein